MLLLIAALLAEPFIADVPLSDEAAPSSEDAPAERAGDPPERTVEASVRAVASSRGEGRAEISARTAADGFAVTLGAAESAGVGAEQRQEISVGVESGAFRGAARLVPQLGGLLRVAGEAGVHFDSWGLVLDARTASIGLTRFGAAGARLEVDGELAEAVHAGASAAASLLWLDAPPSADPWTRFGTTTLDWAQRWDAGGWMSFDLGPIALTPAAAVAQPAHDGAFEARGSLAVEVRIGPARIQVEAAGARQWGPAPMWLFDVSAGVTMSLY